MLKLTLGMIKFIAAIAAFSYCVLFVVNLLLELIIFLTNHLI